MQHDDAVARLAAFAFGVVLVMLALLVDLTVTVGLVVFAFFGFTVFNVMLTALALLGFAAFDVALARFHFLVVLVLVLDIARATCSFFLGIMFVVAFAFLMRAMLGLVLAFVLEIPLPMLVVCLVPEAFSLPPISSVAKSLFDRVPRFIVLVFLGFAMPAFLVIRSGLGCFGRQGTAD
jgi:hypothetical protein